MTAAPVTLAVAQAQHLAQLQPGCYLVKALFADQLCPQLGELPLGLIRMGAVEILRHQHSQHAVPQKFQPLVAEQTVVPALVCVRGMGQRVL